jgi:hypothetical protein
VLCKTLLFDRANASAAGFSADLTRPRLVVPAMPVGHDAVVMGLVGLAGLGVGRGRGSLRGERAIVCAKFYHFV